MADYSQLIIGETMKDIDRRLVAKCPKYPKCSAPLCPLDPDMDKRFYIEGDPICRLPVEELITILNRRFKRQYSKYMEVCLGKKARLGPVKEVKHKRKKHPKYEQLEMKIFTDMGDE